MKLRFHFSLVCAFLAPVATASILIPQITVNVYNDASVPDGVLLQAQREAARILGSADVHSRWITCTTPKTRLLPDSACLSLISSIHLALRVLPYESQAGNSVLGNSFLSEDGDGTYIDVFYPPVQRLGKEYGIKLGSILGAAMAHEVGHLLLGTHAHSRTGIMQPHWDREDLQKISMGRLLFTDEQAHSMRRRLLAITLIANFSWGSVPAFR